MGYNEKFDSNASALEGFRPLERDFYQVEELLKKNGIIIKKGSRFYQYKEAILVFNKVIKKEISEDHVDLALLHQAAIEFDNIRTIVTELSKEPETKGWKDIINKVLIGHEYPQVGTNERPRDFQFELLMAALCKKAGFKLTLEEPDIIIHDDLINYAVAAKRPKSYVNLPKTIKKACKQIEKSGYDGIIAIDISKLENPQNNRLGYTKRADVLPAIIKIADSFYERNSRKFHRDINTDKVFGIIIYVEILTYYMVKPQIGYSNRMSIISLCNKTDKRYHFIRKVAVKLGESQNSSKT